MRTPLPKSFTLCGTGTLRELVSGIGIRSAELESGKYEVFDAIWDTGSTATIVKQHVVDACGLFESGAKFLSGVTHSIATRDTETDIPPSPSYRVNIALPSYVGIRCREVVLGDFVGPESVLIGMDIITLGDFVVSTHNGKTSFSFRCPSPNRVTFSDSRPLIFDGAKNLSAP